MIDVIISNSKYITDLFKKFFWYDGEVLQVGLPRNDIFFNTEYSNRIKEKVLKEYNIDANKKIILFAPTFRDNFNVFELLDIKALEQNMSNHVVLVRAHPGTTIGIECSNNIIDATNYSDIQELIIACDYFISDYSSCIFDAATCKKDVYLFAPDLKDYLKERGINFVYEELPFPIAYSSDQLIQNLKENACKSKKEELKLFEDKLGIVDDGTASKSIVKRIEMVLHEGKE